MYATQLKYFCKPLRRYNFVTPISTIFTSPQRTRDCCARMSIVKSMILVFEEVALYIKITV